MRLFGSQFGFTSGIVNTLTISSTVPELKFQDTTASELDWDLYVDGDKFFFEQNSVVKAAFATYSFNVSHSRAGSFIAIDCINTATGNARFKAQGGPGGIGYLTLQGNAGSTAGEYAFISMDHLGVMHFKNNTNSITTDADDFLRVTALSKNVTIPNGNLIVQRSSITGIYFHLENTDTTTGSSYAQALIETNNTDSDPYLNFRINDGSTINFSIGIDNSDSNQLKICASDGLTSAEYFRINPSTNDVVFDLGTVFVQGGFLNCSATGVIGNSTASSAAISTGALTAAFGFSAVTASSGFLGQYIDTTTANALYSVRSDGTDWYHVGPFSKTT